MTAIIPTNTIFSVQVTQLLKNCGYHAPQLNLPESEWKGIDITFLKDNVLIISGRTSCGTLTIRYVGEESIVTKPHDLLKPLLELFGIPEVELDLSRDVVFQAGRGMPHVYYKCGLLKDTIAEPYRSLVVEHSEPCFKDGEAVAHVVSVTRSPVLRDDEPHVHLS